MPWTVPPAGSAVFSSMHGRCHSPPWSRGRRGDLTLLSLSLSSFLLSSPLLSSSVSPHSSLLAAAVPPAAYPRHIRAYTRIDFLRITRDRARRFAVGAPVAFARADNTRGTLVSASRGKTRDEGFPARRTSLGRRCRTASFARRTRCSRPFRGLRARYRLGS